MRGHEIIAAFIAVFVAIIIFLASIIFSFDPYSAPVAQPAPNSPTQTGSSSFQCANASGDSLQSCCESWAERNDVVRIRCLGNWTLNENAQCSWQCQTDELE